MTNADAQTEQVKSDAKLAQQLQQAEQGQAGAAIVQGIPVGAPSAPAAVVLGAEGRGLPYPVVLGISLPVEEILVLRYRFSMMCFATIDIFSTALHAFTVLVDAQRVNANWGIVGLFGLIFLIGPLCGLSGARRLNTSLVAVYLAFCIVKTGFEFALAIVTPYLMYVIASLIQLWITKIVFTFWRALRALTPQQKAQLLDPTSARDVHPGFAYW